ncbi:TonB-dependent receptor plug domain-containing protein [Mucilaginibacter sp.]|jgi:hypothetical protein|uniref:TonB-dependent receptor plug domain-containing protein n=1 Tax=Mucilaginibacter sp. TaxID=1882438 RepID=UPI002C40DFAC|nr:TonB-dependent receptor plug domain-containing protein [Mucilaginibacter sp.]HTI57845.1 TonB-dependent receptor plug domain-containing protein [Mucilaginibacter sp.]
MKKNAHSKNKGVILSLSKDERGKAFARMLRVLQHHSALIGTIAVMFFLFLSLNTSAQNVDTVQKNPSKTSFTGDTKPLIILDGIPYKGDLKSIDPNTIMDVTILKGNNATSVYGSDASDGAVVIRTKNYEAKADTSKLSPPLNTDPAVDKRPLIILDGKEYTKDLKTIDPHTIVSINVLKNKNATDKYGQKAVNGVLEIATKK